MVKVLVSEVSSGRRIEMEPVLLSRLRPEQDRIKKETITADRYLKNFIKNSVKRIWKILKPDKNLFFNYIAEFWKK